MLWLNDADRKMQDVIDEETQDPEASQHDVSGDHRRFLVDSRMVVADRSRLSIHPGESNGQGDMNQEEADQASPCSPEKRMALEPGRGAVHDLGTLEDREVPKNMND